jgi:hypothetical protein
MNDGGDFACGYTADRSTFRDDYFALLTTTFATGTKSTAERLALPCESTALSSVTSYSAGTAGNFA